MSHQETDFENRKTAPKVLKYFLVHNFKKKNHSNFVINLPKDKVSFITEVKNKNKIFYTNLPLQNN